MKRCYSCGTRLTEVKDIPGFLNDMFAQGTMYEVVVTTLTWEDGMPRENAAAIGVVRRGDGLHLRLFAESNTFENVRKLKRIDMNIVTMDEIDVLARAALVGWGTSEREFREDDYYFIADTPFLNAGSVQVLCRVVGWEEEKGNDDLGGYHVGLVTARAEEVWVLNEIKGPIKRGSAPVLEALVLATRWRMAEGVIKKGLHERITVELEKARMVKDEASQRAVGILEDFLSE